MLALLHSKSGLLKGQLLAGSWNNKNVMNLDKFNKWFTLSANLGVLAGIVFLALEINQNTTSMRAETYQSRTNSGITLMMGATDQDTLASALSKTQYYDVPCWPDQEQLSSLSDIEYVAYVGFLRATYARLDNQRFQYEQGMLDEDYFRAQTLGGFARLVPLLKIRGSSGMPAEAIRVLREYAFDIEAHECAAFL